ncbi:MAG: phosphatidylserine decarboxylase [Holdemanella sp.]|nr:phosphatidylserine decarboxylase [Holdemanella sp.]
MKADLFYKSAFGRFLLKLIQGLGFFKVGAWYLHTKASKSMISSFIEKNKIDMSAYQGQTYNSYAEFFARKMEHTFNSDRNVFISPCDGLLSIYPIEKDMIVAMKGSHYRIQDIIPDSKLADEFNDGLFLIFRLEATDYHHFCSFDDLEILDTQFIEGQLHSVQPIACETVPVYRLNRRWISQLATSYFQKALQIEVGAMIVGGVHFAKEKGKLAKGDEMGNFELAGSTIVLVINKDVKEQLALYPAFEKAMNGKQEVRVKIGEGIGRLKV